MRQTYQRCETEQPFILPAYTLRCIQQKSLLIGGGGENRTRVLKSPHRGFIFNQNPAPPLYLKSRLKIKKVTFKNIYFYFFQVSYFFLLCFFEILLGLYEFIVPV